MKFTSCFLLGCKDCLIHLQREDKLNKVDYYLERVNIFMCFKLYNL